MLVAGIDIGSGTTKCVLVDGDGRRARAAAWSGPRRTSRRSRARRWRRRWRTAGVGGRRRRLLGDDRARPLRRAVPRHPDHRSHLRGAGRGHGLPATRSSSSTSAPSARARSSCATGGKVKEFHMNEKCAAGSGRLPRARRQVPGGGGGRHRPAVARRGQAAGRSPASAPCWPSPRSSTTSPRA